MAEPIRPPPKLNGAYYVPNAYAFNNNNTNNNRKPPPRSSTTSSSVSRRSRVGFCCRCFCSILLVIILLLGIGALVIYLLYNPKLPTYTVQDVKIQTLKLSSGAVDSDVILSIQATNPNKKIGIKYLGIDTTMSFDGAKLGSSSVPGFFQGRRNVTVVKMEIRGSKVAVSQSVAGRLKGEIERKSVVLNTRTIVRAKVKVGKVYTPSFKVRVRCALRVSPPTGSTGAKLLSKSCKVNRSKFW